MKKVKVYNSSKKEMILEKVFIADSFFLRLRGLLGKKNLENNTGLIIDPCNSVHSFGMRFSIDVIFVDKNYRICKIISNMKKGKVSPIVREAKLVIEANAGLSERLNLEENDMIEIIDI